MAKGSLNPPVGLAYNIEGGFEHQVLRRLLSFETEKPTFFWIYEAPTSRKEDEEQIWWEDPLGSPVIASDRIKYDYLTEDYGPGEGFTEMVLEEDGFYHWRGEDGFDHWYGIRADSPTHMILTGRWLDHSGTGVFIAVFPKEGRSFFSRRPS